jgi:hypothetical protein
VGSQLAASDELSVPASGCHAEREEVIESVDRHSEKSGGFCPLAFTKEHHSDIL